VCVCVCLCVYTHIHTYKQDGETAQEDGEPLDLGQLAGIQSITQEPYTQECI